MSDLTVDQEDNIPFLTYCGAFFVFIWFLKLCYICFRMLKCFIMLRADEDSVEWEKLPKWAVITGGSTGIGRAYADEFAKRGFNIVLISKTKENLQNAAHQITTTHLVKVLPLCIDFTSGPQIYDIIRQHIANLPIGVLVNNVGMSYKYPEYFHAINNGIQDLENLLRSNVVACTMMMRIVLPGMETRKRGVIINVSSLMAVYPMPLLSVYSASKVYVDYLARATHVEYIDKGIIIQSVLPGYVATKMSNRKVSLEVPSPKLFAECALKTVGFETYTFGYISHQIRGFVHEWLRDNMPTWVNMAIAMHFMKNGRNRYLRRRNKVQN